MVEPFLTRLHGVTVSRLRGPVARKGTRWWTETKNAGHLPAPPGAGFKALDVDYVLPDRLATEVQDPVREALTRVARVGAAAVNAALTRGSGSIDEGAVNAVVEKATARFMDAVRRHVDTARVAIRDADGDADTLDEVAAIAEEAIRRDTRWLLLTGNTLAAAVLNEAALRQARALGATHKQWLSRPDDRVRPTHVQADGAVVGIDEEFRVGLSRLDFPADPTDIPQSWPEIAECRCSMLFPAPSRARALAIAALGALAADTQGAADTPTAPGPTTTATVGYRRLAGTVEPGQRFELPEGVTFERVAGIGAGVTLAVYLPAGMVAVTTGDTLVTTSASTLEILGVGVEEVTARVVESEKTPV